MMMSGTHAIGGLVLAVVVSWVVRSRYDEYPVDRLGTAAFGFVLGGFLPDADFLLTVPVYLLDERLAEALHRSFSHSFVAILPVVLAGASLYARRDRETGTLVVATGAGMAMHVLQDLPFWFEPVALLWPVFHLLEGAPRWFGVWAGTAPAETPGTVHALVGPYVPPEDLHSALFSWEYGSIAAYLGILYVASVRLGTDAAYRPRLKRYVALFALVFVAALALVPFLGHETHTVVIWGVPWYVLWPLTVLVTVRMRETIESLGREGLAGVRSGDR